MSTISGEFISLKNSIKQLASIWVNGLRNIREALQDKGPARYDANGSHNANRISVPAVVKVVEGMKIYKSAADKKDESEYQKRNLKWQKRTFWAVIAYSAEGGQ